jgi:hypothetical protein
MQSSDSNLSQLTHSKLQRSLTKQDSRSLHRWVLLKNSISYTPCPSPTTSTISEPGFHIAYNNYDADEEDDDADDELGLESHSYMFPDAGQLVSSPSTSAAKSEAAWLDTLLANLADDEDDDYTVDTEQQHSTLPVEDDDFHLYSPIGSPMSSSDDLPNQPDYYPSISVQYPVPYPDLIHAYHFDSITSSSTTSYEDPFPYHSVNDLFDLPEAIEDTSDDESDVLTTPSIGRSTSSISLVDAASIPLPAERSRLRPADPRVYVNSDHSYLNPFEFDPLPFPGEPTHTPYNHYQEC